MMPWPCAASSASAICRAIANASSSQLHHQRARVRAVCGRAVRGAVDLRDVGMIQRRQRARFAVKAREALGIRGHRFGEDFEGDLATELRVRSAEHFAHSAGADLIRDLVVTDA